MDNMKVIDELCEMLQIKSDLIDYDTTSLKLNTIRDTLQDILPLITTSDGYVLRIYDSIYSPEECDFRKYMPSDSDDIVTEFNHEYIPTPTNAKDIGIMHSYENHTLVSSCYWDIEKCCERASENFKEYYEEI